jgi:capsular polysaccharide transport system permease protein
MKLPSLPSPSVETPRNRSPWQVQRAVLFALVLREMKARVDGQWVGAIWALFEPLAHVLVILAMIAFLRGRSMPGVEVPVFLAVGMLPYFLYRNLQGRLMEAITANRGLFSYRQVKPLDALASRAAVEVLMSLAIYIVTLGLLGWLGYHVVPRHPLEALGAYALVVLLGTSVGTLFAVLGHERPRVKTFVRLTSMPLYFASGVVIPLNVLPPEKLAWLMLNPLAHIVDLSRWAFVAGHATMPGTNAMYPLVFTVALMALALLVYRANRLRLVTTT